MSSEELGPAEGFYSPKNRVDLNSFSTAALNKYQKEFSSTRRNRLLDKPQAKQPAREEKTGPTVADVGKTVANIASTAASAATTGAKGTVDVLNKLLEVGERTVVATEDLKKIMQGKKPGKGIVGKIWYGCQGLAYLTVGGTAVSYIFAPHETGKLAKDIMAYFSQWAPGTSAGIVNRIGDMTCAGIGVLVGNIGGDRLQDWYYDTCYFGAINPASSMVQKSAEGMLDFLGVQKRKGPLDKLADWRDIMVMHGTDIIDFLNLPTVFGFFEGLFKLTFNWLERVADPATEWGGPLTLALLSGTAGASASLVDDYSGPIKEKLKRFVKNIMPSFMSAYTNQNGGRNFEPLTEEQREQLRILYNNPEGENRDWKKTFLKKAAAILVPGAAATSIRAFRKIYELLSHFFDGEDAVRFEQQYQTSSGTATADGETGFRPTQLLTEKQQTAADERFKKLILDFSARSKGQKLEIPETEKMILDTPSVDPNEGALASSNIVFTESEARTKDALQENYSLQTSDEAWNAIKDILADETFDGVKSLFQEANRRERFLNSENTVSKILGEKKTKYGKYEMLAEYEKLKGSIPQQFHDYMDALMSGSPQEIENYATYNKISPEARARLLRIAGPAAQLPNFGRLKGTEETPGVTETAAMLGLTGMMIYGVQGIRRRIFGFGISSGSGIDDKKMNINNQLNTTNNQNMNHIQLVRKSLTQFMLEFRGLIEDWKANSIDINGNVVTDCQIRVKNGLLDLCSTWNISPESGVLSGTVNDIIKQLEVVVDHCKTKLDNFENETKTKMKSDFENFVENQDALHQAEILYASVPTNKLAELEPDSAAYEVYKRYRKNIADNIQPKEFQPQSGVGNPPVQQQQSNIDKGTILENMYREAYRAALTKMNNAKNTQESQQIQPYSSDNQNALRKNPDFFSYIDPKNFYDIPSGPDPENPATQVPQPDGTMYAKGISGNKPKAQKFRSFMRNLEKDIIMADKLKPKKPLLDDETVPKIVNVVSGVQSLNGKQANFERGYGNMETTDEKDTGKTKNIADALNQVQTRIKSTLDKVSQQVYVNALDTPDKLVSLIEAGRRPISVSEVLQLKTGFDMYPINNQVSHVDAKNSKNIQLTAANTQDRLWRLSALSEENLSSALNTVKTELNNREVLLGQTLGDDFQNAQEDEISKAIVLKRNRKLISEASDEIKENIDIISKGLGANDMTREYIQRLPDSVKNNIIMTISQVGGPDSIEDIDFFFDQGGDNREDRLNASDQIDLLNDVTQRLQLKYPGGNPLDNAEPEELLFQNIRDKFVLKPNSIGVLGMANRTSGLKNFMNEESPNFLDMKQLWGVGFYMAAARSFYNKPVQQLPTQDYVLKTTKQMSTALKDQSQKNPASEALINEINNAVASASVDDGTFLEMQEAVTEAVGEIEELGPVDFELEYATMDDDNLLSWEDIEEIEANDWTQSVAEEKEEDDDNMDIMDYLQGLQVGSIEETIQGDANKDTLLLQAAEETEQDPTGLGLDPTPDDPDDDLDGEADLINFDDDDEVSNKIKKNDPAVGGSIGSETNTIDPRIFLPAQFSEIILDNFDRLSARHGYLNRPLNMLSKAEMAFGFDTAFAVNFKLTTIPVPKENIWAVDKAVKIAAQRISYAIAKKIADQTFVRQLKGDRVDSAFISTMNRITVRKMALMGQQNILLAKTNQIPVPPRNPELDTQSENPQYNSYKAPYTMKGTVLAQNAREMAAVDEMGQKLFDATRLALTKMEMNKDSNFRKAWNLFNSGALDTQMYKDMMIMYKSPRTTEQMADIFYRLGSRTADVNEFGDTLARLTGSMINPETAQRIFNQIKDGVKIQNNIFRNMGQSMVLTCCYDGQCQNCRDARVEKAYKVRTAVSQFLQNTPGKKMYLPDAGPSMSTGISDKGFNDELAKVLSVPSLEPGFGFHSQDAKFLNVTQANMEYSRYKRYADSIDRLMRSTEAATGPAAAQVYPSGGTKDPENYGTADKSRNIKKQGVGESETLPKDSNEIPYTNDTNAKIIQSARYRLQIALEQLNAAVPVISNRVGTDNPENLELAVKDVVSSIWMAFVADINKLKLASEARAQKADDPAKAQINAEMLSKFANGANELIEQYAMNQVDALIAGENVLRAEAVIGSRTTTRLEKIAARKDRTSETKKMIKIMNEERNALDEELRNYYLTINENSDVIADQENKDPTLERENKAEKAAREAALIGKMQSSIAAEAKRNEEVRKTLGITDIYEDDDLYEVEDPTTGKTTKVRREEIMGPDEENVITVPSYKTPGKNMKIRFTGNPTGTKFDFVSAIKKMFGKGMNSRHNVSCRKCGEKDPDDLFHVKKELLCKRCINKGVYTDRGRINKEDLEKSTTPARTHPKYGGMISENENADREINFQNKSSWDHFASTIPSSINHEKIEKQLLSKHITYGEPDADLLNVTAIAVGLATHKYDHLDKIPDTLMSNIYGGLSKFSRDTKRREYIDADALDNFTTLRRYIKFDANNLLNNIVNK